MSFLLKAQMKKGGGWFDAGAVQGEDQEAAKKAGAILLDNTPCVCVKIVDVRTGRVIRGGKMGKAKK